MSSSKPFRLKILLLKESNNKVNNEFQLLSLIKIMLWI